MTSFLLDTCTISDLFAGVGRTKRRIQSVSPGQITVSAITVMEILYGFELNPTIRKKFSDAFQSFRDITTTIPFDSNTAETAARIRANLKSKGSPIGSFDLLIGACALTHGHVLVTSNEREFERIDGLIIEDWR